MLKPRMPQLQGNPIWFDLVTPDPTGAKTFYSGLFGWEWAGVPMSGGSMYHMAIKRDENIAGMFVDDEAVGVAGVWINRVFVTDAAAAAKRIEANGGRVLSEPHNADGWGVTATVATPEGYGADVFSERGAVCWVEYHTHVLADAKEFHSEVFCAGFEEMTVPSNDGSGAEFTLTMLSINGEQMPCAFAHLPDATLPASWATYFMVEDIHAAVAKAQSLGAELTFGVMDVPPGSLASLVDPQGVRFSLWQAAG